MNKKVIIIYYTWSENTAMLARVIQQKTAGQLFEISPVIDYPANYRTCVEQAKKEINSGYMPELKELPDRLESYDIIFIGSPIWWYTMAPPVHTFLSQSDLSLKTVVPFCTHGGGGKGNYVKDILKLCPNSNVLDDMEIYEDGGRSAEKEISRWLNRIGVSSED